MASNCRPGTISAATAEDAGRFMDAMLAARKKQGLSKRLKCRCGKPATTMLAGVLPACEACAGAYHNFGVVPRRPKEISRGVAKARR
jgi:hypothetical protein